MVRTEVFSEYHSFQTQSEEYEVKEFVMDFTLEPVRKHITFDSRTARAVNRYRHFFTCHPSRDPIYSMAACSAWAIGSMVWGVSLHTLRS